VPRVILDTSVSLPATLSPTGMARKLWVLLAYGALNHQVEHQHMELDLLRAEAETTATQPAGLKHSAVEAEAAERQRGILRELLPHNAPEQWVALGSAALFDEYERKVREIGKRLNPNVRETDVSPYAARWRRSAPRARHPLTPRRRPSSHEIAGTTRSSTPLCSQEPTTS
jgi:hypothetical protein